MRDDAAKTFGLFALIGIGLALTVWLVPGILPGSGKAAPAATTPAATTQAAPPTLAPAPPASAAPALPVRPRRETRHELATKEFRASVSSLNGGLRSFELLDARYRKDGKPIDVVTTDNAEYLPMALALDGVDVQSLAFDVERLGPSALELRYDGGGLRIARRMQAGSGPYQVWITTHISNTGTEPRKLRVHARTHHYVARKSEEAPVPLLPVRSPALSNALCKHADGVARETSATLLDDGKLQFKSGVRFIGIENAYFLNAVAPEHEPAELCALEAQPRGGTLKEPEGTLLAVDLSHPEVTLAPGKSLVYRHLAYLGPKTPNELARAGRSLKEAIDTGFFTAIAEGLTQLLRLIYDWVGNWGLAIILLTLLVKSVLYPLTAKQMESMAKMKNLKPEMDRINQLYADDREKKGAAVMELYRKEGVNPMGGCFPMLLQLPIWFSLYTSLSTNVELFHAPFALWWTDLSSPDPIFSLPLGLGALMFVQQKMAPASGMDPVQQKMMLYMMPAMITSFMLFLPAGLCLYMLTNSVLSIAQQRFIERRLSAAGSKGTPATTSPDSSPSQDSEDSAAQGDKSAKSRPSKAERRSRRGK
jgi:YidC/Oxa1 family membrane protein insertase